MARTKQPELLRQLGIRHFDDLIHDQPKEWLLKYFKLGADEYPINVSLLMRNLVWQMRERVISGEKPPLKELVRTYWYMYVKPTLSRAGALSQKTDQYAQLVDTIVRMVKEMVRRFKNGEIDLNAINDEMIADHLYTRDIPDPDLLIRTSGEMRISNFLLWQIAYAEIFVTPTLWPDFSREELLEILKDYQSRERRFGRV